MTKEEYKTKVETLNWTIRVTEREKRQLKKEYIETACPYAVGDKVKIVTIYRDKQEEVFGFVERISVNDDGKFTPECSACKKDGTRHARNKVFVSQDSEVTKVTE